ncbi:MAG: PDZ domain-containing protein [Candidatus Melainabacteria bacterium]|nr:PDZ domain-containing protein [Candidatus Melainabacteria bacterium]
MLSKQTAILLGALVALYLAGSASVRAIACMDKYDFSAARAKQRPWRKFHNNGTGTLSSSCGPDPYSPITYEIDGEGAAGVGMEINQDRSGHFVVKRIEPLGPAAKSKIFVGDRILKVNGVQIDGLNMSEVVKVVRGDVRTKVKLQLQSAADTRTISVKRAYVAPSNHVEAVMANEKSEYAHPN